LPKNSCACSRQCAANRANWVLEIDSGRRRSSRASMSGTNPFRLFFVPRSRLRLRHNTSSRGAARQMPALSVGLPRTMQSVHSFEVRWHHRPKKGIHEWLSLSPLACLSTAGRSCAQPPCHGH
jgi:hypothetical protein